MPNNLELINVTDFPGLMPALQNEQPQAPHIVRGKNFNFDINGPKSGYGACCLSNVPLIATDAPYTIMRQGNESFIFTCAGIYQVRDNCQEPVIIFEMQKNTCTRNTHPWTQAYVGDSYYYANPCGGVIKYDTITERWEQWDLEAQCISGCVYGVASSDNRLIVLAEDTVSWSEIDRGDAIECNHHRNAGFQSLSLIEYGKPIGVYASAFGFFTITSNGIMYSQPNNDTRNPYRHSVFATEDVPISATAVTQFMDSKLIVYLAKTGLRVLGRHSNNQFQFEEWQPTVSHYIKSQELKYWLRPDYQEPSAIRFFYCHDRQELFISFKDREAPIGTGIIYCRSLVYNIDLDKWSSFDEPHRAIGNVTYKRPDCADERYGYLRPDYLTNEWTDTPYVETTHEADCVFTRRSLDSWIEVGPMKTTDQQYADTLTFVTDCQILSGPLLRGTEFDPNTETHTFANIDAWEEHLARVNHFNAQISGSLDSYTLFENEREALHINRASDRATYYVCYNQGIYHTLLIEAKAIGHYYHIEGLKLSGHLGGRL